MNQETSGTPCSCGHDHSHQACGSSQHPSEIELQTHEYEITYGEADFLISLALHRYLPVCQFVLAMSTEDGTKMSALAPVIVLDASDDVTTVKEQGELCKGLEEKGMISFDYDIPLKGFSYEDYYKSAAFASFVETVNEGKSKHGFLFDTAEIETGSMALTSEGELIVEQIEAKRG